MLSIITRDSGRNLRRGRHSGRTMRGRESRLFSHARAHKRNIRYSGINVSKTLGVMKGHTVDATTLPAV